MIQKKEHLKCVAYVGLSAHIWTFNAAHQILWHRPYSQTQNHGVLNIFTTRAQNPPPFTPTKILLMRNWNRICSSQSSSTRVLTLNLMTWTRLETWLRNDSTWTWTWTCANTTPDLYSQIISHMLRVFSVPAFSPPVC